VPPQKHIYGQIEANAPVMKKLVTEAPVPFYGIVGEEKAISKKCRKMPLFLFSAAKMIAYDCLNSLTVEGVKAMKKLLVASRLVSVRHFSFFKGKIP
jgi:hypothetical protein